MSNYTADSIITRAEAWADLKEDFTRFDDTDRDLHVYTDIWVNITRMVSGPALSRDRSQVVGRVLAIGVPIALVAVIWSAL